VAHGWSLYAHPAFAAQFANLVAEAERARSKSPEGYRSSATARRLAAVVRLVRDVIPGDPARPEYALGHTLGAEHSHWRRAKFLQQYRLFFRFHSASRVIVFGWMNDDASKRAYGSRSDAYRVFAAGLRAGRPPDDWSQLLREAKGSDAGSIIDALFSRRPSE
jgi:toxin YhaV